MFGRKREALPGPAGRDLPKQEVSCDSGWAASLGGEIFDLSVLQGPKEREESEASGCPGGWVK